MNYPQHILDRPLAEIQDLRIIETGLTGRNSDLDALLRLLDAGSDKVFRRSDLDLLVLAPWLPRICLHDFVIGSDGQLTDAIVRFQGAEIAASYSEITGQSIFAHPERVVVERTLFSLRRIFELRTPIMTTSYGIVKSGADLSFQTLYVPLSSDGEDVVGSLLFACIKPLED